MTKIIMVYQRGNPTAFSCEDCGCNCFREIALTEGQCKEYDKKEGTLGYECTFCKALYFPGNDDV